MTDILSRKHRSAETKIPFTPHLTRLRKLPNIINKYGGYQLINIAHLSIYVNASVEFNRARALFLSRFCHCRNQRNKLTLDNLSLPSPDKYRSLRHQYSTDNMHVPTFNIPNLRIEQRKTSSAEDMARKNSIGANTNIKNIFADISNIFSNVIQYFFFFFTRESKLPRNVLKLLHSLKFSTLKFSTLERFLLKSLIIAKSVLFPLRHFLLRRNSAPM